MAFDPLAERTMPSGKRWRLSFADPKPERTSSQEGGDALIEYVESQYPTDDIQFSYPGTVAEVGGFGSPSMGTVPGTTGPYPVQIQSVFQAQHNLHDIRPVESRLLRMHCHDPKLGRRPLLLFEWGHHSGKYWLEHLDIRWERGHNLLTQLPKRFSVSIGLKFAQARPLDDTRQGEQPSTWYHTFRAGETYEHLAYWYLGNPNLSPLIRRTNPGVIEEEGKLVMILPRANKAMQGKVVPVAPCFYTGFEDTLQAMAEDRL